MATWFQRLNVPKRRKELGINQLTLALALGYKSQESIAWFEHPTRPRDFPIDLVPALADALKVDNKIDLAHEALSETHPNLYKLLFGKKALRKIRYSQNEEQDDKYVPARREWRDLFDEANPQQRDLLLNMARQLVGSTPVAAIAKASGR